MPHAPSPANGMNCRAVSVLEMAGTGLAMVTEISLNAIADVREPGASQGQRPASAAARAPRESR